MERRLREVIGNQLILNSPSPTLISELIQYISDETYAKHFLISDQI